jgi:hypothetical protein
MWESLGAGLTYSASAGFARGLALVWHGVPGAIRRQRLCDNHWSILQH